MPNITVQAAAEGVPSEVHVRNRIRELAYEISALMDRVPLAAMLTVNPASSADHSVFLCEYVDETKSRNTSAPIPADPAQAAEHHARRLAEVMATWPEEMRFQVTIYPHDANQRIFWFSAPDPVEELRQLVETYDRHELAETEFVEALDDDRDRTPEELAIYKAWCDQAHDRTRKTLFDLLEARCQNQSTRKAQAEILLGIYKRDRGLVDIEQMLTLLEAIAA